MPTWSIFRLLFQYPFEQRASDIHDRNRGVNPGAYAFALMEVLHTFTNSPFFPRWRLRCVSRLKTLGRKLNVAEEAKATGRADQDHKSPQGNEISNLTPVDPARPPFGEKMACGFSNPDVLLRTFDQSGLFPQRISAAGSPWFISQRPLCWSQGRPWSGKTTTL